MSARCRWCGVFVAADTPPMVGLDRWGVPVAQVLCPTDRAQWRELAALNVVRGPQR